MSDIRTTLHQLAVEEDRAERVRLSDLLASQLEVRENNQSNRTQVAIWDVQESGDQKLDRLHEQIGDSNTLMSGVLEAIGGLRTDVQASAAEVAARLGKIEGQQKRQAVVAKAMQVEQKRQGAIVDARPAQRAAEFQEQLAWRASIERELSEHRQRLEELEQARQVDSHAG